MEAKWEFIYESNSMYLHCKMITTCFFSNQILSSLQVFNQIIQGLLFKLV